MPREKNLSEEDKYIRKELAAFFRLIRKNKREMLASPKRELYLSQATFSGGERISNFTFE